MPPGKHENTKTHPVGVALRDRSLSVDRPGVRQCGVIDRHRPATGHAGDQIARGMLLPGADDDGPSAVRFHHRTLRHGLDGVVRALAVHIRLHDAQQPLDRRIAEDDDVVDRRKRRQDLCTLGRRDDGTAWAFQRRHRAVVIHRDDEPVGFAGGPRQIADVSHVDEIEAPVRKRQAPTLRSVASDGLHQLRLGHDPTHHQFPSLRSPGVTDVERSVADVRGHLNPDRAESAAILVWAGSRTS